MIWVLLIPKAAVEGKRLYIIYILVYAGYKTKGEGLWERV